MPPAARVLDVTAHGGVLGPPAVMTVLIGGAPAAVMGSLHTCVIPMHPPSPVTGPCSVTVRIGGLGAARVGDLTGCGAPIAMGCPTVQIGG